MKKLQVVGVAVFLGLLVRCGSQEETIRYEDGSLKEKCEYAVRFGRKIRHGMLIRYHRNGSIASRMSFRNGQQHGPVASWHDNGMKKVEGERVSGEWVGEVKSWYRNGMARTIEYYRNGRRDGGYLHLDSATGKKRLEGNYRDGRKHGVETAWDEAGNQVAQIHYRDGKQHGTGRTWYPSGQIKTSIQLSDGEYHGVARGWHGNGRLLFDSRSCHGKPYGKATRYDEHGSVVKVTDHGECPEECLGEGAGRDLGTLIHRMDKTDTTP